MKEWLKVFGIILLLLAILWPWLLGGIDLIAYFLTDNQLTFMKWNAVKVIVALVYPFIITSFVGSVFVL